jgi:DNA-binding transcriptional LysR family regulator
MDQSLITLDRIRTFVRVVERGTLSAVARERAIGQSSVTRHLRELEDALGVALLSRTTRRVSLTEEGQRYYAQAVQILRLVEQANQEARSTGSGAVGTVRLSCTAALGVRHISRLLFAFQDHHPNITVDLNLTDERINLVREGVDIALRLGPLTDSSMKLRPLGISRRLLVAAPSYLASQGTPRTLDHLAKLDSIRMSNMAQSDRLTLQGPNGSLTEIALGGRLRVDHGLAAREALLAGRGFGATHLWLIDDLLAGRQLEQVLPDYAPLPVPLNMLIVPERAAIARVRLLIDFLVEHIPTLPGLYPTAP